MKRTLALIILFSSANVLADSIVYGKAFVSFQSEKEGDSSTTALKNNASRIGVKGGLPVDNGIEAIYKAEFEVQFDDGEKDGETLSQRNIYVGVKGGFGELIAGKFDTPLKVAQNKIDLFNDLNGDIKNIITKNDNRVNNIVSYETPTFSAFKGKVAIISSEIDGVDDGISSSFAFEQYGLYLALAYDQDVEGEGIDVVRVVAQYNISGFQFGALYETVDTEGFEDSDAALASFKYTNNKWSFKGQYGTSDIVEADADSTSLGIDYKVAKQLKLVSYFTNLESDFDTDNRYLGVGVELKF